MSRPAWIADHPDGPLLDGLLAVAWADGVIAPEERAALAELVDALFLDLPPAELELWYTTRPDPDEVATAVTDPFARRYLLDRALTLARADGAAAAAEEELVARWAATWGIGPSELADMRAEVEGR